MQTHESLNQYFTEQIVGGPVRVSLGPSSPVRRAPSHGVVIDRLSAEASVLRQATLSLLSSDPTKALTRQPLNLPGLVRVRRRVVALLLLCWTALVAAAMHWWPA